jgi:hypothetical protein
MNDYELGFDLTVNSKRFGLAWLEIIIRKEGRIALCE